MRHFHRKRLGFVRPTLLAAGCAVIFLLACEVTIDTGKDDSGGPSLAFALAGVTIKIQLGQAGVFNVAPGVEATTLSDVVPFDRPPTDTPVYAALRIAPGDVTFRQATTTTTDSKTTAELLASDGARRRGARESTRVDPYTSVVELRRKAVQTKADVGAQQASCNNILLEVSFDKTGADACVTGTAVQTIFLDLNADGTVQPPPGLRIDGLPLRGFLDNGFSMCLRTRVDGGCGDLDRVRGTLTIDGLSITFGPRGSASFVLANVASDPNQTFGPTIACCYPPLAGYHEFLFLNDEDRRQFCLEQASLHPRWTSEEYCLLRGGKPQPRGVRCSDVQCDEDFRACCHPDPLIDQCYESSFEYCANGGAGGAVLLAGERGAPQAKGVSCADNPSPCLRPRQACCTSDGACFDWALESGDCPLGAIGHGEGTSCLSCPCGEDGCMGIPIVDENEQGCCIDGRCRNMQADDCGLAGGRALGPRARCTGDDAQDCPAEIRGACCLPTGQCDVMTEAACEANEGRFAGDRTICPCRGACCAGPDICFLAERGDCEANAGRMYRGDLTTCDPNPCDDTVGACCRFESQSCERVEEDACNGRLDVFLGVETQCPEVCPIPGACCFRNEDGTPAGCGEGTQSACTEAGGILFVPEKDCAVTICPQPLECCIDVDLCGPCPFNGSFERGLEPGDFFAISFSDTRVLGWAARGVDYIGTHWVSSDGSRSIDLDGTPGPGAISQTIPTVVGVRYRVTFDMAGNPEGGAPNKCMMVRAAGQSQDYCFNTEGRTLMNMGWREETFVFTATEVNTLLEFVSLTPGSSFNGVALDNVRVD